ncbi:uncharacterized protein pXO1-141/BXA0211/GBAA_pXO1_0211 [Arthrobacter sp. Hiyo1]|uniref:thermonuclease family protein n=1 Tax=Arthrobacter sp. Hiyo1 TaxID=1588020 RepID=UPI0006A32273|nr:thermonuclease family protein [Arthrobacter sp. Hiyo1]GAP61291.1 uncharacterized protein pXO1-141/BXA0211/GBAA_pXO1_0211 [Arthrobacter sp. Hiyo1]
MSHSENTPNSPLSDGALSNSTATDPALITMTLPMSLDGEAWHDIEFEGESARYVDQQAAAYVIAYRDRMHFGVCESVRWADFPATYHAIFLERTPRHTSTCSSETESHHIMTQYLARALPVSGLPRAYGRHSVLTILIGLTVILGLTGCQGVPSQPVSTDQTTTSPVAPAAPSVMPTTETPNQSAAVPLPKTVKTKIVRVVDGDTIAVQANSDLQPTNDAGTQHTVRLLGIDAPEMNYGKGAPPECGAQAATDHLTELLPKSTEVTITYDQTPGVDRTDRYGRSLAYVSTSAIADVNLAQLKSGYAEAWIPKSATQPERWNDYLSAAELPKYAKTGAYGAPEHCQSLGRK